MKKIAALVCLSAGLFCLFPDDAQAQRATWSGFGRNSSYEFDINLKVQDTDENINRGFYSQAVNQFSLSREPSVTQYTSITSLGLGDLIISKPQETTTNIDIIFGTDSPIKTVSLSIDYDLSFSEPNNIPNVNVNNLLSFFNDLSSINDIESLFQVNQTLSAVYFTDPDGKQTELLESADKFVKVPEPSFICSFIVLFSVGVTPMLNRKKLHGYLKSIK